MLEQQQAAGYIFENATSNLRGMIP